MRNSRILPLLGPAGALYLIAEAASLSGGLDWAGWVLASLAVGLTLAPLWLRRRLADEVPGARRVATLGVASGIAFASLVQPEGLSLLRDLVLAIAMPLSSAVLFDLATRVPDSVVARLRTLVFVSAACVAALGALAALPAFELFGDLRLVPARVANVPAWFALACVAGAFVLRLGRRRAGSAPAALAANAWAELGLAPGLIAGVALAVLSQRGVDVRSDWAMQTLGVCAAIGMYGHTALVDPKRRLRAAAAVRAYISHSLTLATLGGLAWFFWSSVPAHPVAIALVVAGTWIVGLVVWRTSTRLVRQLLAPFGGRLLDAVDTARQASRRAATLDELAAAVLPSLRAASGSDATPLLWTFEPSREMRVDVAGVPLQTDAQVPLAVREHLPSPGTVIVAADVIAQVVRRPEWRVLAEVLESREALCLIALGVHGEIEGALLVPRGRRRARLTLEEMEALRTLGFEVGAQVALIAASERAGRRARSTGREVESLQDRMDDATEEARRLRAEANALRAGRGAGRRVMPLIAYSASMRALETRLAAVATMNASVAIVAEGGIPIDHVARRLHQASPRKDKPFVVADCGGVDGDTADAALFGDAEQPGWLALAEGGTLLLADVVALPPAAQAALADALASQQARTVEGVTYGVDVRIVATSRLPLDSLQDVQALDAELAQWLGAIEVRVPALRERREDIPSLALLALDRACRVLGRGPIGIEQSALDVLLGYSWPGNLRELQHVIDHAVANAQGEQVRRADLPSLLAAGRVPEKPPAVSLDGTYAELEKRILVQALERADGNKSEAARLLGLKRTTFLDKCRRHELRSPESMKPPATETV